MPATISCCSIMALKSSSPCEDWPMRSSSVTAAWSADCSWRARIREQVALGDADWRAAGAVGAGLRTTGGRAGNCCRGQQHLEDVLDGGVLKLLLQPRQVAAGDVAGFVRDDALHLAGAGRLHE